MCMSPDPPKATQKKESKPKVLLSRRQLDDLKITPGSGTPYAGTNTGGRGPVSTGLGIAPTNPIGLNIIKP